MRVALLLLACASLWISSCESDKVVLQFNAKNPSPEAYRLNSQANWLFVSDSLAPQSVGTQLQANVYSTRSISYSDSSERLQFVSDSVHYSSDQFSKAECKLIAGSLQAQNFQFKLSKNGALQAFHTPASSRNLGQPVMDMSRMLVRLQPVLPSNPVSLGDTWESQLAYGDEAGQSGLVYKWFQVEDLFIRAGKTMAKLRMNIKYHLDAETAAHYQVGSEPFILGTGSVVFNVTDGQIEDEAMEISGALRTLQIRQQIHLQRLPAEEQLVIGEM